MKYLLSTILAFILSQDMRAQKLEKITECVQLHGKAVSVELNYNMETGAKSVTVKGKEVPFNLFYKTDSTYAKNQKWYLKDENIIFNGKKYGKFGLPRILEPTDVEKAGVYKKTTVFVEAGKKDGEVIYVFVQPGCEFQPYTKL